MEKKIIQECVAEIALSYSANIPTSERFTISESADAVTVLRHVWDTNTIELQESFKVVLLNNALQVLGVVTIACGGLSSTQVDIRLVMATVVKSTASQIIIAHNHPSGNMKPSTADNAITQTIESACHLLGIKLVDHIIITNESYYSFTDNGILPIGYAH